MLYLIERFMTKMAAPVAFVILLPYILLYFTPDSINNNQLFTKYLSSSPMLLSAGFMTLGCVSIIKEKKATIIETLGTWTIIIFAILVLASYGVNVINLSPIDISLS